MKVESFKMSVLTLSWHRSLPHRNPPIDLQSKSMDWFLYDMDLHHEKVKGHFLRIFRMHAYKFTKQEIQNSKIWQSKILLAFL